MNSIVAECAIGSCKAQSMEGSTLEAQPTGGTSEDIGAPFASLINPFFRFYTKILTYSRLISCFKISIFRNASVKKITIFKIMHNRIHLGASKDANRKLKHPSYSHLYYGKNIKQPPFDESFPFDTWNHIIIYATRRNNSSFFTFACS